MADKKLELVISAKDNATGTISKVGNSMASSVASIGAALATATVAASAFSLKSAASMEQTSVAFQTMLGSSGQAQALMQQLSDFAKETPFEFPELANAGKMLLAFGTSAQNIKPQLTMLGDLASGLGVPISQITYAFGQVQVATRLMGTELMQFTNAGVPLIEALSKTMNVSQSEVKKLVEEGKVGFPIVEKALLSLTQSGGKFHGMMAMQSKTVMGLWSTLSDTVGNLGRQIIGLSTSGEVIAGSIFDKIRTSAGAMISELEGMTPDIISFFQDFQNTAKIVFENLVNLAKWSFYGITSAFGQLFEWMGYSLKNNMFQWSQLFTYIGAGIVVAVGVIKSGITGLMGGFSIMSVALGTAGRYVFSSLQFMLIDFLSPAERAINGVIRGIRNLQAMLGRELTPFVSFATDLGKAAIESMGASVQEGSSAIQISIDEMTGSIGDSQAEMDKGLSELSNNLASSFTTVAIPALQATAAAINGPTPKSVGGAASGAKAKVDELGKKMKEVSTTLESQFRTLVGSIDQQKTKLADLRKGYAELGAKLKEIGVQGAKDLAKIDEQLQKQADKIAGIKTEGGSDVAKRSISAQEELKKLEEERAANVAKIKKMDDERKQGEYAAFLIEKNKLDLENASIDAKKKKLEAEILLASQNVTAGQMATAQNDLAKSEVQLILEKTAEKVKEAEAEKAQILATRAEKLLSIEAEKSAVQLQMDEKLKLIKREQMQYGAMIAQRMTVDALYFEAFGKHIEKQISKTKEAISLINELGIRGGVSAPATVDGARANGGSVGGGKTYLVGERGPELFTPGSSGSITPNESMGGVTVTIGNITIGKGEDPRSVARIISEELARQMQLGRKGIYS